MTEERTQYTVTGLQIENELLRERNEALRKTVDGFTDASSFQWAGYQRRIKELEQTAAEATERISYLNTTNSMRRTTIEEQTARIAELEAALHDTTAQLATATETIARLEQDNRRLRHLDAMPVDALRRYVDKTDRIKNETYSRQYLYEDFLDDREAIDIWLATLDGDA